MSIAGQQISVPDQFMAVKCNTFLYFSQCINSLHPFKTKNLIMKMKLLLTICIAITLQATAQNIPAGRITNWKKAGNEKPYAKNVMQLDILNYGGNPNGSVNNSTALSSAIAALNGKAGVINFPAGDYLFNSSINLPDSVVLRGAGSGSTTLTFDFNGSAGNCIIMNGNVSGGYQNVISPCKKNSKSLKLNTTSGFAVNDMIEIRQLNGAWNTNPATWAEYAIGQILKIDSIKGKYIYFHEKLRIDYDTTLSIQVAKLNMRKACGVECLKMRRLDGTAPSINYGISMNRALNCWVKGVEIEKMICAHVAISTSAHCEVTGCYLHEAYAYDGTSTHGYGVMLESHPTENKIENNIMRHLRHAVSVKQGANGNYIGYNYILEPTRSEIPTDAGADLNLHGHYAFANLFEGNICQNIQIDQSWGPSGPWNTFYRNRADGYGIIITSGSVTTDNQNIVGNDVTNTGFLKGNYSLTGTGHYEYGNRIKGTITPAGTNNLTTTSYYYNQTPIWWTSTTAWPAVGLPYNLATATNPAYERWQSGSNVTVCSNTVSREMTTDAQQLPVAIYPNPANDIIYLANANEDQEYFYKIFDLTGKQLLNGVSRNGNGITISTLANGAYFIQVSNGESSVTHKFFIQSELQK